MISPSIFWRDMDGCLRVDFRAFGGPGDRFNDCKCGGVLRIATILLSDKVCETCGAQHDALDYAKCDRCGLEYDGRID